METPAAREFTDRRGDRLPDRPTAEDIEHQADRLRIVDDSELSERAIGRRSLGELEQRRIEATTR